VAEGVEGADDVVAASVARTNARAEVALFVARDACDDATPGVTSRRSGSTSTERTQPNRTNGRSPPALFVLRTPPFLCGQELDCVGIDGDAMRGRARRQTRRDAPCTRPRAAPIRRISTPGQRWQRAREMCCYKT